MEKTVKTVSGQELPISACAKIGDKYYKVGDVNIENSGDCYQINGEYFTVESGLPVYNISINQYVLITDDVVKGVVKLSKNGEPEMAWFTPDIFNVKVKLPGKSSSVPAKSKNLFIKRLDYIEDLSLGGYSHISRVSVQKSVKKSKPERGYKESLPYGAEGIGKELQTIIDELVLFDSQSEIREFANVLGDKTFGVEFETVAGLIPHHLLPETGLMPLRDGSIAGIEYATGILSGTKGLQLLINACRELSTRTDFNNTCSLHFHIGNIPRTKKFLLALHLVSMRIQDDLFRIHPVYKEDNLRIKSKNYSKPYDTVMFLSQYDKVIDDKNIDANFDILFRYLSQGRSLKEYGNDLANVKTHPADESGRQKWHIRTRYHVINMVPILFTNHSTVEFRIHLPDTDPHRVFANLMINLSIINFVEKNQDALLSGKYVHYSLNNILEYVQSSRMRDFLYTYIGQMRRVKEDFAMRDKIMFEAKDVNIPPFFSFAKRDIKEPKPWKMSLPNTSSGVGTFNPSSISIEQIRRGASSTARTMFGLDTATRVTEAPVLPVPEMVDFITGGRTFDANATYMIRTGNADSSVMEVSPALSIQRIREVLQILGLTPEGVLAIDFMRAYLRFRESLI